MSRSGSVRLGRYVLGDVLGQGAMGTVYRAEDTLLERIVALKVYHRELAEEEEVRRRFGREVKAASRLNHPNIVVVYDGGFEEGIFYFAMEYVEGTTLERWLRDRGRPSAIDVLPLLLAVADGLEYAHSLAVVHRDLKPANLLVPSDRGLKGVKIADFGVAKVLTAEATAPGTVLGTPSHVAPEQIQGRRVDPRADIFSLGVIAYELLTGTRAFPGDSLTSVLYSVMNHQPEPPTSVDPSLPKALDSVLGRALEKEREARTPDARTFADELRAAFQRTGRETRPASEQTGGEPDDVLAPLRELAPAPPENRRWGRRLSAFVLLLGMALGVGALVGADPQRMAALWSRVSNPSEAPPKIIGPVLGGRSPTTRPSPVAADRTPTVATPTPVATPTATRVPPTRAPSPPPAPPPTRARERPTRAPVATRPPPPPEGASIDLMTTPPGAFAIVDGNPKGRTPVRIRGISAGEHRFEFVKEGHRPYERSVTLDAGGNYQLEVRLAPEINSLRVLSTPPGAPVFLDGAPKGRTPVVLGELLSGTYRVEVQLPATGRRSRTVEVRGGQLFEVTFVDTASP